MALAFSRLFFFFNDTATTEIYTLSLHDALPISEFATIRIVGSCEHRGATPNRGGDVRRARTDCRWREDRKSTRLNSSHTVISYAVFCLKKKKKKIITSK